MSRLYRYALPLRVLNGIQKRVQEGASLKVGVVSGKVGQVQANATSRFFFKCDLGTLEGTCCQYRAVHGVPCRHECRLAMAVQVKVETLVSKFLTTAWDKVVYAAAVPVLPMDTTSLTLDNTGPPLWEGRKQRGRPKGSRYQCAIDSVSKGLSVISSQRSRTTSAGLADSEHVDRSAPETVGHAGVVMETLEPESAVLQNEPMHASVTEPAQISEEVVPSKKRGYTCSNCNQTGHGKRSKLCPKYGAAS